MWVIKDDERGWYLVKWDEDGDRWADDRRLALRFGDVHAARGTARNARAYGPARVVRRTYYGAKDGRERFYSCFCLRCGDYLKGLHAGVDEGTDAELCGVCAEIIDVQLRPRS